MLAALLGWPQGTFASKVEVAGGDLNVTREVDGGLETVKLSTPAVVTTDLRLNEPRYASLPEHHEGQVEAARDQVAGRLSASTSRRGWKRSRSSSPPSGSAGIKVGSVDELVAKLKALGVAK